MIKVCIFDCDGTLLDTLASFAYCANRALSDYGMEEIPEEEFKMMVGDGAQELIRRCLRRSGDAKLVLFEKVFSRYKEYFKADCMYQVKPYPGIMELIEGLRKERIPMAVLSNKPHVQTVTVIEECFGKEDFAIILGNQDEIPKKPAPDGALLIAKEFGVQPQECLYVGDTNTDMQTGNNAGMQTVGVLWGFREREELEKNGANRIVVEPCEIAELILKRDKCEKEAK